MKKRQKRWSSPLVLFLLLAASFLATGATTTTETPTYPFFEDLTAEKFNHMTVHDYTERVYIGAVNRIYQLSRDLKQEDVATMGPKDDSPKCPVTQVCPNEPKRPTDYYNKALVVDYSQSKLIACGSLFQGTCTVHDLNQVSNYETPASESVVANNATASTVAFIAPGHKNLPRTHVLYVGASYTGNGPYRSDVPAVSSRSLDPSNTFVIAYSGVTTGTKITLHSMYREIYPITYVYGFSSKGFSYFVTVQKMSTDLPRPFISKLVRVCQRDVHYYSYTEVPLVCRTSPDGIDYNLVQAAYVGRPGSELAKSLGVSAQDNVLFAVFAKSKDEAGSFNEPSPDSALCVYALSAVHRKFTQNIRHCFNGYGERGLGYINPNRPCYPLDVQIKDDFCGIDGNTPLGGSMAVEAAPVLRFSNTLLTAVAATSTHHYTLAFLGTSQGHLKKVAIETVEKASEYADLIIDVGSPINADMVFDRTKNHLYVMTEKRVTRVKVQECHRFKTCADCLAANDPHCGWCDLENKCSLQGACEEATLDPLYWLSYKSDRCAKITEVSPPYIQFTTTQILSVAVDNLPALDEQLFCAFFALGQLMITNATRSATGVTCATPYSLPPMPPGEHKFTSKLSVRMKLGLGFASTNFTFYDCSTFTSCTQCVSSGFPCDWCVSGHLCTHDAAENCRNDFLVSGVEIDGSESCPKISTTVNESAEILVSSGIRKRIYVKVENIQQHIARMGFQCQFIIEGRVEQVNARLTGEILSCEEVLFSYNTQAPQITAAFSIIWDVNKILDNPESIHVLIYRCSMMAESCGLCLELPAKYKCGWCPEKSCRLHEHCMKRWLDRKQTCPDPQILSFTPKSGPWEGGTNITIRGINLGREFHDIANHVRLINEGREVIAECVPHQELYVKTTQITCQVEMPVEATTGLISHPLMGYIEVKVKDNYTATSGEQFSFVNPRITSIKPSKGPKSGGTALEIWGLHMDAGSNPKAFLGALPCNITSRDANKVVCITSASKEASSRTVRIKFDYSLRIFEDYKFLYVEDPSITNVESGSTAQRDVLKGIPSGGITVSVKGTNFNAVQYPYMYTIVGGEEFNGSCIVVSQNEMKCKSPRVPTEKLDFSDDSLPIALEYGFKMDHVAQVQNLSSNPRFSKFMMYPDPIYYPFSENNGIKYFKSDYLIINAMNLDRASQESDIIVRIGTSHCNVTSLSRSQLTCLLPKAQTPAIDVTGEIPAVVIQVGDHLKFTIGQLCYEPFCRADTSESKPVIMIAITALCILVAIVILLLIAYHRKSKESRRCLKDMQERIDLMKLKVADECREGHNPYSTSYA